MVSARAEFETPPALRVTAILVLLLALSGILAGAAPAAAGEPTGPERAGASAEQSERSGLDRKRTRWSPPQSAARQRERDGMVQAIRGYGLTDEAILKAMSSVPRHEFVPADESGAAYADCPLPIGHGQTISQPYMVAEMTRQLELKPDSRVLELGTGSGYQAAVLTHFTPYVYTIEIVKPLAQAAEERLKRSGYDVVEARQGDGFFGWPEKGPFDAIIVTCAVGQVPPPLIQQLKPGGRMVVPVGGPFAVQWLMLVEKDLEGKVRSRSLMAVRFVPLLREDPSRK